VTRGAHLPYTCFMVETRETRASACEIKFVIAESMAPRVLDWARAYLEPDPHGSGPFADEYAISTLYFDTRRFDVFHRHQSFGRAKYRVRRYGDAGAIFFERKLRKPGLLIKRRTKDELVALDRLEERHTDPDWAGHWFHRRLLARNLLPVCQINYTRTARITRTGEGLARLTLDADLRATRIDAARFQATPGEPVLEGQRVLELKYHARVPAVFRRLIEEFSLAPETASKYRLGIAAAGDVDGRDFPLVRRGHDAAHA
jgi:SPX domain protein involved in polyphosphate accumulation